MVFLNFPCTDSRANCNCKDIDYENCIGLVPAV